LGLDSLWKRVQKTEACWNFTGCLVDGYGTVSKNGNMQKAHRISWEEENGPIPYGLYVLHKCDNRRCINPSHLFLGTPQDNMKDRDEKNRQARGEKHGRARLTEEDVMYIKRAASSGTSSVSLEQKFQVSRYTIRNIIVGKRWKHLC